MKPEMRIRDAKGRVEITKPTESAAEEFQGTDQMPPSGRYSRHGFSRFGVVPSRRHLTEALGRRRVARIHPIGVSRSRLEQVIKELHVPVRLTDEPLEADWILSLKVQRKRKSKKLQEALDRGIRFYTIKSNTLAQMRNFLRDEFGDTHQREVSHRGHPDFALQEAEDGIIKVQRTIEPVELSPQNACVRRVQHELIQSHGLYSESKGTSRFRKVIIYPQEM